MDPVFGYQAVNVEAQLRTPTSFLRWLRKFIALRKEHPVFGLGSYEPLAADNPRIFAHMRSYEEDVVLCVHNLANSAQPVQLDLGRFEGLVLGSRCRDDPTDRQPECAREGEVTFVVSRDRHDRAGSVAGEDVIGDVNGHLASVGGIDRVGSGEDAGFLSGGGLAVGVAEQLSFGLVLPDGLRVLF